MKRRKRRRRVWAGSGLGSVTLEGSAGAAAESSSGGPERQTDMMVPNHFLNTHTTHILKTFLQFLHCDLAGNFHELVAMYQDKIY